MVVSMDDEEIRDADEPTSEDGTDEPSSDDDGPEDGPENEPMMPPGEDSQHEDSEGIPLKSIADDVDDTEETEDMTDVEPGDA